MNSQSPRISSVRHLGKFNLALEFTNGAKGQVDLTDIIVGKGGVFKALEDESFFSKVKVNPESGTIQWPNDVDLDPDVLFSRATGQPIPFEDHSSAPPSAA